jgi:hypothetical protein
VEIVWCNSRTLAVGFPKEYLLVDVQSGHITELFPILKGSPLITRITHEELIIVQKEGTNC